MSRGSTYEERKWAVELPEEVAESLRKNFGELADHYVENSPESNKQAIVVKLNVKLSMASRLKKLGLDLTPGSLGEYMIVPVVVTVKYFYHDKKRKMYVIGITIEEEEKGENDKGEPIPMWKVVHYTKEFYRRAKDIKELEEVAQIAWREFYNQL